MKTLIYAMQSSGASLFTLWLAQRPDSIGVLDLHHEYLAPPLRSDHDIFLKAVVTTRHSLSEHRESFQPQRTILFLRDHAENYRSLLLKNWADRSGTIDEKFKILESLDRWDFDQVVHYEEFVKVPHIYHRSVQQVVDFACVHCPWCKEHYGRGWGTGGIHEPLPTESGLEGT